jgi:transcriptional regulator with XRE-family HTH domain
VTSSPMRIAREKKNLTQKELADKVGVTAAQICRIEAEGVPIVRTAASIVHHLGGSVTLDEVCRPERYTEPDEAESSPEAA